MVQPMWGVSLIVVEIRTHLRASGEVISIRCGFLSTLSKIRTARARR